MSTHEVQQQVFIASSTAEQIAATLLALHDAFTEGQATAETYAPALHLLYTVTSNHAQNLEQLAGHRSPPYEALPGNDR